MLLTGWYGYFELRTPTNPGSVSTVLSIASLSLMIGLSFYGYNVYNKFKKILWFQLLELFQSLPCL